MRDTLLLFFALLGDGGGWGAQRWRERSEAGNTFVSWEGGLLWGWEISREMEVRETRSVAAPRIPRVTPC